MPILFWVFDVIGTNEKRESSESVRVFCYDILNINLLT